MAKARRKRAEARGPAVRVASRRRSSRYRLRPASLADLTVLVRHRRGMWNAIGRGTSAERAAHDRQYRRWVRAQVAAGHFFAFIAETSEGDPVGSGAIWLTPSQPRVGARFGPYMPYIMSMYTEPSARGAGVASRILRAMVAWARENHYPRVVLHASKMGRPVYERLGFRSTNEMRLNLRVRSNRRRL